MLTNSRLSNYNEWIKYFLTKIIVQTKKHIGYIDSLDMLYNKTKTNAKKIISSPKFDAIMEFIFTHPVMKADRLSDKLSVSHGQAVRYLNMLESAHIIMGDDKKRGRTFFFGELIDLVRGM
jgi:response regulator of citrate/malate metabolism